MRLVRKSIKSEREDAHKYGYMKKKLPCAEGRKLSGSIQKDEIAHEKKLTKFYKKRQRKMRAAKGGA